MKNILLFLVIFYFCNPTHAQQYWSKTYDPFEHEAEGIRNVKIEDGIIYASCRGTCFKDTVNECFKIVKFDLEGNLLEGYEDKRFETGYGLESDDDWLYVDGGNEPYSTKMSVNRISKDYTDNELIHGSVEEAFFFANASCTSNDQYVVVYGSYVDSTIVHTNGRHHVNGMQMWVNKETFQVDTIISFLPTIWFRNVEDMFADEEGNFYSIQTDEQLNVNSIERPYFRITKQNSQGNIISDFTYPVTIELSSTYHSNMIMMDDQLIFRSSADDDYGEPTIVSMDTLGNKNWEYIFKEQAIRQITPRRLFKGNNNNIFVLGLTQSYGHKWADVAMITSIDATTGELLWERTYEVDKGQDLIFPGFAKFANLHDLHQMENGDIYVAGYVDNMYEDPNVGLRHDKDLWLMKLDSTGCMAPNCGNIQSIQNGVVQTDSCKWLVDDAKWFFTPWSIGGPSSELVQIEVVGDTLIGDRVCAILGVYRQNEFLSGSEMTVFYEKENEKVYLVEAGEFKLLFDFSFSFFLGDTMSYYLPEDKLAFYDISSGGGEFTPADTPLRHRNGGHEWIVLPGGEQIRVVKTELVEFSEENCYVMGDVIDGIGSINGLIGKSCLQLPSGTEGFFRCFQSATLNYTAVEEGCVLTSVDEIAEHEVNIYPNPTTGFIKIETEYNFSAIKIFNIMGKLLLSRNFMDEIDLGGFLSGLYLMELSGKDGVHRKKLILKK